MRLMLFAVMVVLWLFYLWRRPKHPRIRADVPKAMDEKFRQESPDSPVTYHVPETLESLQIRYGVYSDLKGFRQDRERR